MSEQNSRNQPAVVTEEQKKARCKAMQLLEHKDRTEKELSARLKQAGFSAKAVENAMDYVRSYGYLNDERYASVYIRGRIEGKSRQKILQELQAKGIDRETAMNAWEQVEEQEDPDERRILRNTILKKYEPDSCLDEKQMRRLQGFLARRGFQYEDVASVLLELNIVMDREKT